MNSNCNCNGLGTTKKTATKDDGIAFLFIVGMMLLFLSIYAIVVILIYIRSWKFHGITKFPKQPDWLLKLDYSTFSAKKRDRFTVYTKPYERRYEEKSRAEVSKTMMRIIRETLQYYLQVPTDYLAVPDSTCIVSIPSRNFISGEISGEFEAKHGGPPDSYYEYQMIGENVIQVAWFVVSGVRYVAGVCIYLETPYESWVRYREKIILDLLSKPAYWSTSDLREETMQVLVRKRKNELTLFTRNRYGEQGCFRFVSHRKQFEKCPSLAFHNYKKNSSHVHAKQLTIRVCQHRNEFVMIATKNGTKMHASWNRKHRRIEYSSCASCADLYETQPPTYQSLLHYNSSHNNYFNDFYYQNMC